MEIQGLIGWEHPYVPGVSRSHDFTEEEKLMILRLPRKECRSIYLLTLTL